MKNQNKKNTVKNKNEGKGKNGPKKGIPSPVVPNLNDLFGYEDDKEPDKNDYYYDAMELLSGGTREINKAIKLLNKALELDEDYVQTYIGFTHVYGVAGEKKKANEAIKIAYEKTLKKFPKWPAKMQWGIMENRAYMRSIQYMSDLYWDNGEKDKAIELFRLLLKLNPNDNQGVRYEISALYAGLTGEDVNRMMDEGNEKQDWSEQENLVKEQNAKHKFWKEPKF